MSKNNIEKINYVSLINESVHTSNDIDIGDIFAVNKNFIVVVRDFLTIHYYYIPLNEVEGWDGKVLWLKISEEVVKSNYERNMYPDDSRYIVKDDFPYEKLPPDFPEPIIIPSKGKRLSSKVPTTNSTSSLPTSFICDLCSITFKTEEDLSKHIRSQH